MRLRCILPNFARFWMVVGGALMLCPSGAAGAIIRVPADQPTLQAAVDAAADGDTILVDAGRYAGATVTKRLTILGQPGAEPTLVGAGSPTGWGGLRVGLLLAAGADGTRIENLHLDGAGVSDDDTEPLAIGIYGSHLRDVVIRGNTIFGTVQAITGTAANHWTIQDNVVSGFTAFVCRTYCGGGSAIVLQVDRSEGADPSLPANRPRNNIVRGNAIWGAVPTDLNAFGMAGILLLSADSTEVSQNYVAIPHNPANPMTEAAALLLTAGCCGVPTPWLPGVRFATLLRNQGHDSDWGLIVEGTGGQNTEGLVRMGNTGRARIEGVVEMSVSGRAGLRQRAVGPLKAAGALAVFPLP
ncbi:MAG: hypothetical protein RMK29_03895 [Myxococcales bacterium]|nr:hypothetical protein [Myxococcota bacterium]MDW8280829.1 hypothetical protein [Myxococcales bacterium]